MGMLICIWCVVVHEIGIRVFHLVLLKTISDYLCVFWKACFDFVHIIGTVTNYDIIPYQNVILSICTILNVDKEGLPVFRFEYIIVFFFFGFI